MEFQCDYYTRNDEDLEDYEEHFVFNNYCIDLEFEINSNQKIKELLNNDKELILTFRNTFFNSSHLMTIMQLRPLVNTVIFVLTENLKIEINKFKIKAKEALLLTLRSRSIRNPNYLQPAIVVDAIRNIKFQLGPDEVRKACEQSLLQLIIEHN